MMRTELEALAASAEGKLALLKRSPLGYFALSMLAGGFVALGGFVSATVGGMLAGTAFQKLLAAFAFTAALSLVIAAGCELFTGNNLVFGAALMMGRVPLGKTLLLWLVCWLGNLAGSWLFAGLYLLSGAMNADTEAYIGAVSAAKAALPGLELLVRGALCNMCVCLAVWCSFRLKSEAARLVMVFWCILVFMVCGFEHSVANMSTLGVALCRNAVSVGGYVRNVVLVTLGNMAGGIGLVALPYWLAGRKS